LLSKGIRTASFRDPGGFVLAVDDRIIRIVNRSGAEEFDSLMASRVAREFWQQGRLVRPDVLQSDEVAGLLQDARVRRLINGDDIAVAVEHERVPFPSYPYEWCADMLHAAGSLTLDLADGLLAEDRGLKDATPYNVLFRGPTPVFVDLLSIERRQPGDPVWLPYAQFIRTFLAPLLVYKYFGVSLGEIFLAHRDGLEPEEVYAMCGTLRKLRPPFLTLASIPTWLAAVKSDDASVYRTNKSENADKARFILAVLFRRLRRLLEKSLPERGRRSRWSEYMVRDHSYTPEQLAVKDAFVKSAMAGFHPKRVLDVGCNMGRFSKIAANGGASVVAIDVDPVVIGEAWRNARADGDDILPLVVNLTRPSPAVGWRNQECFSFLDRARGSFDLVLMLAVIHHMLVTERIPAAEIVDLAAELTVDLAVIEFVGPSDPMFRRIARGRDALFAGLTADVFEATCRSHFTIVRREALLGSERSLYLLRKKK
jgi:predicted nicotinamide N-methyase